MTLWKTVKRLVPFVRPYRLMVLVLLGLTLIGAVTAQVNAIVLRYTVDTIAHLVEVGQRAQQSWDLLLMITGVLAGKEVINVAVRYGQSMIGEQLRVRLSGDLLQSAIARILRYDYSYFTEPNNATGKLQVRIDRGAESLTRFVQNIFIDLLPLVANAAFALVLMFRANFMVGLVAAIIAPCYFLLSWYQANLLKGLRYSLRRLREARVNGLFNIIESIIVIKSFVREDYEREKQEGVRQELVDAQLKQRKTNYTFDALKTFAEQVGVTLIILLTAYLVLNGDMTIGAIMFHVLLFNNVSSPIRQLHRIYDEINEAMTYAEGFFEVLDADPSIEASGDLEPAQLHGDFVLRDVDFVYPNGTQALFDVSMHIPAGKTVALVGLSGAGKSTLINLLCKFYTPTRGSIALDGHDLSRYNTHYLRRNIGLVLQKNHIFKGSIAENIRYGNMHATDEQVQQAARQAYLHEQVMQLPKGYQSDAQLLSGGQQQRIAIARLFLKNPPVIFLDEPTASLDAIATEQIKNSLDAIKEGRTVIIISHSISQILDADEIVVLKQGRVVESGTHETLVAQGGAYSEIFHASARSLNLQRIADSMQDVPLPLS